jgi:hypothetical protein
MDSTSPLGEIPQDGARVQRGLRLYTEGELRVTKSPSTIFTLSAGTTSAKTIARYFGSSNIYTLWAADNGNVYAQSEAGGGSSILGTGAGTPRFVQADTKMLWTNGAGKIQVWDGNVANPATDCGVPAGTGSELSIGAVNAGVPGNLNSFNKPVDVYDYLIAFEAADGTVGNPNDIHSTPLQVIDSQITVTIVQWDVWPDKWVSARLYRRGGIVSDYYYVDTITLTPSAGPYPATAATYTDNIADIDLSDQVISYSNEVPPEDMSIIAQHRQRIFMAKGGTTRLYFSAISKPESYASATTSDSDGGYIDLPGGLDDGIVSLSSVGNVLVIGRDNSVYTLYGNNFAEYNFSLRANQVGVASPTGMVRGGGYTYFIGSDKRVYLLTDDGVRWVSENIQSSLDGLTSAVIALATLSYADNQICLSFQSGTSAPNDVAYVYDLLHSESPIGGYWYEENGMLCRCMIGTMHPTDNYTEFVFATTNGALIRRMFATAASKDFIYQAAENYMSTGGHADIVTERLSVESAFNLTGVANADRPSVLVSTPQYTRTYDYTYMNYSSRVMIDQRVRSDMIGEYPSITVFGKAVSGSLYKIRYSFNIYRRTW